MENMNMMSTNEMSENDNDIFCEKKYIIKAKDHNSFYFSRSGSEPVMWIRIDCLRSLESIYFFRFRLEKYNFLRKKLRNLVVKICFSLKFFPPDPRTQINKEQTESGST